MKARTLFSLVVVLSLTAGACTSEPAVGYEELTDIDGVEQLSSEFNAHQGSPRLILLLSPT